MNTHLLNASPFSENCKLLYNNEFENIVVLIIACYKLMIKDKIVLPNDENEIRNKLVYNYLENNEVRYKLGLLNYRFEPEVPEKSGRTDIKITSHQTFLDTTAYYIIECKRVDNKNINGETGLNARYISEGMARFVSGKYSMHENTSGMIGFVVENMDIHKNVSAINTLLIKKFAEINTEMELTFKQLALGFKYTYISRHKINGIQKIIYHLMLDFSGNISS